MMISNQEQITLLLRCLGCGVWLNLAWVILGYIRHRFIRTKVMRFIIDVIGATASGFCLFLFSLAVSGGELRAAMLIAVAVGAAISHASLGRMLRHLMNLLYQTFSAVFALWTRGLQKGGILWRKIRKKVVFFSKKHLQFIYEWVYNRNN